MSPNSKMFDNNFLKETEASKKEWEATVLKPRCDSLGIKECPRSFYTPLDVRDKNFLTQVGFPGGYPFTAGASPISVEENSFRKPTIYGGYGTPEDTRDFFKELIATGRADAPHIAFDLPTQCGLDSDNPMARGEVGVTGVAVDSLRDFEVIYEAFQGKHDLDKIYSSWVINAPANIMLAMYIAMGEKRGIPISKLSCVPQNDILKEYVARSTYIFPPQPSMRLIRDTITFCTRHMPLVNPIMISGVHIREAGATAPQVLAFTFANGIAYVKLGIDAGLNIDEFASRLCFLSFGGSMDMFQEIALQRAARRMWARIMREKFGAKDPASWTYTTLRGAIIGNSKTTVQRPLNNLTRSIIGGVASALSGGGGKVHPCYDEPLGLGHSTEAQQLQRDAERIIKYEAKLCDVVDPLAGSYYVESLTDNMEAEAWKILSTIENIGGAVPAIEKGLVEEAITSSAYETQKSIERGEEVVVGVNKFVGPNEIEVIPRAKRPHPYSPARRRVAEKTQIKNLLLLRRERDNAAVSGSLKRLREAIREDSVNSIPPILEAVKAYATVGEICDTLAEVFGRYRGWHGRL